jgi:aminomethyltransferase
VPTVIAGHDVLLARTGYTGEDGFEVYAEAPHAEAAWTALADAGSGFVLPAGLACRDTLRLEAGMPLYGNELTADMTPFDAGLGRVVKFDKAADFVGRAALARRRDETDTVDQVLVGLVGEGRRAARHGYPVLNGEEKVGEVTSGALSPTLGHPIAMAYVPPPLATPDTKLTVDIRGKSMPVSVVKLPFYKRP